MKMYVLNEMHFVVHLVKYVHTTVREMFCYLRLLTTHKL